MGVREVVCVGGGGRGERRRRLEQGARVGRHIRTALQDRQFREAVTHPPSCIRWAGDRPNTYLFQTVACMHACMQPLLRAAHAAPLGATSRGICLLAHCIGDVPTTWVPRLLLGWPVHRPRRTAWEHPLPRASPVPPHAAHALACMRHMRTSAPLTSAQQSRNSGSRPSWRPDSRQPSQPHSPSWLWWRRAYGTPARHVRGGVSCAITHKS